MRVMVSIPEHVVVQEILERAYADLPIDTRLHFKLLPRRLGWGQAHEVVSQHLAERRESAWPDGYVLASAHTLVECSGQNGDMEFDRVQLSLSIHQDEGDIFYSVRKLWLFRAGYTRTLPRSQVMITERVVAKQITFYKPCKIKKCRTHQMDGRRWAEAT